MGGTFDPVHRGHLEMADAATRALALQEIFFVPAHDPWHKPAPTAAYEDRFAMLALALAGHRNWRPVHIPAARGGRATYAVDQLAWLRHHGLAPQPPARFHWIVGADSFLTLPTWKHYRQLLRQSDFIVLARGGATWEDVTAVIPADLSERAGADHLEVRGGGHIHWIAQFRSHASSTTVRRQLAAPSGRSVWVPAAVAEYAQRACLYRYAKNL
ncbi:MAG TPA: nicotinate (nicotinamide) nucleotide adenylyltransferase [Terriglobales bacterium]|nr:nicotinate (nicotinamide) nucleotide adenylyltransferase [Terriglobales bacterium]